MPNSHNRDIVVIGGSAGAFEAIRELVRSFPANLPASVFIVIHIGAKSYLKEILGKVSGIPVGRAMNGTAVELGRVYVAEPDRHLLLHDSHILLRRGPRENGAR